jgi:two-component system NtrC family sensor kinase
MKSLIFIVSALISFFPGKAQNLTVEKLKEKLGQHTQPDTVRIILLNELASRTEILHSLRDSLISESLQLSRNIQYPAGEAMALTAKAQFADKSIAMSISREAIALAEKSGNTKVLFWAHRSLIETMLFTSENIHVIDECNKALEIATATNDPELIISAQLAFVDYYKNVKINYPAALEWALKASHTADQYQNTQDLPGVYRNIGLVYLLIGEQEKSLLYLQKALAASRQTGDFQTAQSTLNDIGERYRIMNMYPEALKAYAEAARTIKDSFNMELNQSNVADVYQRMGKDSLCFHFAFLALAGAKQLNDTIGISWIDNILSRAYLHVGNTDSSLYYAKEGYEYAIKTQSPEFVRDNSQALANAYAARNNFEQSLYYYKIYISARDSMFNNEISNKTNLAQYNYDLEKKQAEITALNKDKELQESKVERQRLLLIGTVTILLLILVSLIVLSRNISRRKKAYAQLHEQKQEIQSQRDQTNHALNELKLAQAQLIQSEKMASLGELTAGIAHEIQNPLNFVNNFSEVSNELIDEMNTALDNGDVAEAKAIANDVKQNLEKINHHGKRADGIVKGMLQHSRSSTGQKEFTDINMLADEYLRLAYHGLRAKDKTFNANMLTDFDQNIGMINIIPQDIGRVILNLITNAFYAVTEKKKRQPEHYLPTVTVSTKKSKDKIEIRVKDNGPGIPQKVLDKIFQPFFTTKPTGEGTGLGLSLSYDIVKAHGGELQVETSEAEGTTFTIKLPQA